MGFAAELSPITFLQGSYKQQTAIYSINDVDIVVLCNLTYPGTPRGGGKSYGRDEIFRIIAAPLLGDGRYRGKVRFGPRSMCIKVDLGIKVEILPVVFKTGNAHQAWLSIKNSEERTEGNFIPSIKVLKHIRSLFGLKAVSFHIECLLYFLADALFLGAPADYLASIFRKIAAHKPEAWYGTRCITPCGDRDIFTESEWGAQDWWKFHERISWCSTLAEGAIVTQREDQAIEWWQAILGKDYFPARVA
jgi:hypothetical protein